MEHWINMSAHSKFCVYCDKQISLSSLVLSVDARHATSCTCCLPACVVVLKSARTLCRVYRADCALLYRVCGWCSTTTCSYIFQKRLHKIKGFGDEGCCKKNDKTNVLPGKWQKKALITERPKMFQLSLLRKEKDKRQKTYTYCPCSSACPKCFWLITFKHDEMQGTPSTLVITRAGRTYFVVAVFFLGHCEVT